MGLKKGQTNNPRGRPAGTPNKVSTGVKMRIREFFDAHWGEMSGVWSELSAKDKATLMINLLPYLEAKLQSVEMSGEINVSRLDETQLDEIAIKIYNYGQKKDE